MNLFKRDVVVLCFILLLATISIGWVAYTDHPTQYRGLSTETLPTVKVAPKGSTYFETDTGRTRTFNGTTWTLSPVAATSDTATISSPGSFPAFYTAGYKVVAFIIRTTNTNTSSTYRFLGKINSGGLGWFNLDTADSTTIVGNTTIIRLFNFAIVPDSVKATLHSESGGTAVTPTVQYKGGDAYK